MTERRAKSEHLKKRAALANYEEDCEILDVDQNNPELTILKDEDEHKQINEAGKNSKNTTGDGNNTPNKEKESAILSSGTVMVI